MISRQLTYTRFANSLVLLSLATAALAWPTSSRAIDDHLLLSEAVVTPTPSEFLEIYNPTNAPVALDDYYLSDDEDYALLPGASGSGPAPGIGSTDFIVQFPAGATIAAGGVIVVAFDGAGFFTASGSNADFEIHGTDAGTPDMIATDVGGPTAGLTNSGENAVLFFWDGASDLVQDVDMLNIGTPSTGNDIGDKTGVSVDGPDGDTTASMYATDAFTMPQQAGDPGFGFSTKRTATEAGFETNGGGNGLTGDDETSEDITMTWDSTFTAPNPGTTDAIPGLPPILINEVDVDQTSTDTAEFIELYDGGLGNTSLDGLVLVVFNGSDDQSYNLGGQANAIDLDGFSTDANGYFVIGNAGVAGAGITFSNNTLQNGQDAVALYVGDGTDFPNDTAITTTDLLDALVYDTNDGDDAALLALLNPGEPQINEDDGTDSTTDSNQRCPNGGGGGRNTTGYFQAPPTPGADNACTAPPAMNVLINEVEADQAGTEDAEFIELYDGGVGNTPLDGLVLVTFNGSDDQSYNLGGQANAIDLDGFSTDANGFFVIGNTGVPGAGITFGNGSLQNGADAVALFVGDGTDFPNDTAITTTDLIDAVVYDTNDGDDAALLVLLNPGEPQVNEESGTDADVDSSQRCPDGGGGPRVTSSFLAATPSPGAANTCPAPTTPVIINEADADQTGTDAAEFIELYDGGVGNTPLDGLVLVTYNGSDDQSYNLGGQANAVDLDGFTTDANGYFVLGNPGVPGAAITFSGNSLQNGQDAVALYFGNGADFPNDTPLTTTGLVDALVYDTDDGDDAVLLTLLTGGGQVNENETGMKDVESNQRCPNGTGGPRDTSTYTTFQPTPGTENCVTPPATFVLINEADADTPSIDTAEFIELFDGGVGNTPLDGLVLVAFNGSDDQSYNLGGHSNAIDLDGFSTDASGFFVIGNSAVANVDLTFGDGSLQNGADAVALYVGNGVDFPNDTPVTTAGLIDALVYDTDDGDDAGLLVLLAAAEPQVNERGGGSGDTQSNQRCPNGGGGPRVTTNYLQEAPTPGTGNFCIDATAEIFEIQGAGLASPFAGMQVQTLDNIVTAVAPDGFFIQTPDGRADVSPDTSNGIFVFTGAAPAVAVGDQVDVIGLVEEFFDFTEMTGSPIVMVDPFGTPLSRSTLAGLDAEQMYHLMDQGTVRKAAAPANFRITANAGPLPAAVIFNGTVPSMDPTAPSCAIEFECYESMLIQVTGGTVCSGNQGFGPDPVAEVFASAAGRCLREPGIEFPGLPGLPLWDSNPEQFEVDADKLIPGNAGLLITAGSTFDASGPLGYEFSGYEIFPTSLAITPRPLPEPVRSRAAGEMTVGSLNMFRFFDDIDDPADPAGRDDTVVSMAEYLRRKAKFALYILDVLDAPDILGVQEAEKIEVLQQLAADITAIDPSVVYTAHLVEGNDIGTIDVGFLTRANVAVDSVTQLGAAEILTFDGSLLNDRPLLLLEGRYQGNGADFPVAVMVNHTRSLSGIDDSSTGPRVRQKRLEQANSIGVKVQAFQDANPTVPLVVIGDLNAFQFTDGYVDVVGRIAGNFVDADDLVVDPTDNVDPDLTNQVLTLAPGDQHSFEFRGNAQVLDHALTTVAANVFVRGFNFGHGNAEVAEELIEDDSTPLRSSDHDGFALFLMTDFDADGIPDDVDNCPSTANSDQADGDGDGLGNACDNCPAVFNTDQADGDTDGIGNVCDNCPTTSNSDQADGDTDGTGDVCDNCPTVSNSDQADGDTDSVGDLCDNCPNTPNPGQEDGDQDGVGDACDDCVDGTPPVFTVTEQDEVSAEGTVEDCSGITDLMLGIMSNNVTFEILSGVPGDTLWTWRITVDDPLLPAFAELIGTDGEPIPMTADTELIFGASTTTVEIPTLDTYGLILMLFLLALGGLRKLRRPQASSSSE
ncbi:MAG: thrombospondin type 3 repeat-containing protein [Deltaproteobacteria bacterium]|nr:thrombospondin type 3 repeat-containing protein [Deltaproteobacteria bacterium]